MHLLAHLEDPEGVNSCKWSGLVLNRLSSRSLLPFWIFFPFRISELFIQPYVYDQRSCRTVVEIVKFMVLITYDLRVPWTCWQCLSFMIAALIEHLSVRIVSGLLPALTAETLGKTHQTSGPGSGGKHICPMVSCGPQLEANIGFPKGFVWLGAIWLNPVLHNPQPTPSAWRPRCVVPARPAIPSNTTAALSFTGFYSLCHPFPCSN